VFCRYPECVNLVADAYKHGAVVGHICHGGSLAISAKILKGVKSTAFHGKMGFVFVFSFPQRCFAFQPSKTTLSMLEQCGWMTTSFLTKKSSLLKPQRTFRAL
jgi:hypothetical protein